MATTSAAEVESPKLQSKLVGFSSSEVAGFKKSQGDRVGLSSAPASYEPVASGEQPGTTGEKHSGDSATTPAPIPDVKLSSWPWFKWIEAFLIRVGILLLGYFLILTLQQYEIWEPCQWKISYHRECKVDTYLYEVLSYTTFKEDFFCIVPGITFHEVEAGWNVERNCQ